ncbi:hypothetical protein BGX26_012617 [Mortierella sp. AD094]|nr:hypothetical protein BGX26_012617 [Mortierella sp. AD094]
MALAGLIITLRSISIFFSLICFGLDIFFIKMYQDHLNVGFTWRFYVQTGLVGILTFYFIIVLTTFIIHRRRLKYGALPADSRNTCHLIGAFIQAIFLMGLSVGLLYTTIPALTGRLRSVILLPFNRESPQDQSGNHEYTRYAPANLFNCPSSSLNDSLSLLCDFDGSTIAAGTAIGVLAIFEAIAVIAYQSSSSRSMQSYWRNQDANDYEHSQPLALESYPKTNHV